MKRLSDSPAYWIALGAVVYPLLFVGLLGSAFMPPLNMIGVPLFFFLIAGAVGGISNGYDEARSRGSKAREPAPFDVPLDHASAWSDVAK